ncbi:MAG: hypothetical protein HY927_06090 [Elusimicrobia bacterium]|nr:hypothetical protein [Elusimicrobiota bacterium]
MKIFLGGTRKTPWRQKVTAAFPRAVFFDPTTVNALSKEEAARTEIAWIRESDVCLFCFREGQKGRCSGFEMGAAHALGKAIVYVDNPVDPWIAAFAFALTDLDQAIVHLGKHVCATCGDHPDRCVCKRVDSTRGG